MLKIAVYDTKPYDKKYLEENSHNASLAWEFMEFHLNKKTASTARGHEAVCVFVNDRLDKPCIEELVKAGVRYVAFRCAGFNNIDLPAAKEAGLQVTRVPAYSPHGVAEHSLALLLALNRKIHTAYHRVREFNFSLNGLVGFNIAGKTVGIYGTGKIGKVAAKIFKGFDANVICCDKNPDNAWASENSVRYVTQQELFSSSDIVMLYVPLVPELFHVINAESLALMKKGVYIVNTSRGKLVDTKAIIEALKKGHVAGVALDVYEEEENVFFEDLSGQILQDDELSRLLTFPNVIVTSHQAFLTHEALTEIARVTTENMLLFEKSKPFPAETVL